MTHNRLTCNDTDESGRVRSSPQPPVQSGPVRGALGPGLADSSAGLGDRTARHDLVDDPTINGMTVQTHADRHRGRGVVLLASGDEVGSLSVRLVIPSRLLTRAEISVLRAAGARVLDELLGIAR